MNSSGHKSIEHTADLAVRAWAPDLRGLIEQAARGMLDLMLAGMPAPESTLEIDAEGETPEDLLVDCLREVLLLIELAGLVPVSVDIAEADGARAHCLVGVVPPASMRHALLQDIKAVTYHGLEIRDVGGVLEVEVVFDV